MMRVAFILLAAGLIVCSGTGSSATKGIQQEFLRFKEKHGKVYASRSEEEHRFEIFKMNYEAAIQHNKAAISTFTRGINQFSDLTKDEFKASYLGLKHVPGTPSNVSPKISKDLPASVNWVEEGAVTAVKNQGQCGSCWAFATTEQIESYMKINGGELLELSAQQVTSCTPNVVQCGGSGGCFGSVTQLGFNYLQLFGQMTEADYPYESGSSGSTGQCSYDYSKAAVSLTGYNTLPANNQSAVMTHLAEVGPLAIAVDASQWGFYTG